MNRRALFLLVLAAIVLASVPVVWAQAPPPFTVEEMLKLKRISDPQLSPDGTRIAYVAIEVNLDGNSRRTQISFVPPVSAQALTIQGSRPRWSPDGKQLAYDTTDSRIVIYTLGTGTVRALGTLSTGASGVTWSPDGKWIAFVSDVFPECNGNVVGEATCNDSLLKKQQAAKTKARVVDNLLFRHWTSWKDGRYSHLLVMPADGSAPPRDLTPGRSDVPPFSLGGPDDYAFSPDSREIAYATKTDPVEAVSTNSDIFTLDFQTPGAQPKQITTGKGADSGPQYSPDGKYLSWRSQQRAGFEADKWTLTLVDRTTGERKIVAGDFDRPVDGWAWTPDSKAVYLTVENDGGVQVYRAELTGGAPRLILKDGSNGDVQVSADGKTLVFTRQSLTAPAEIYRAAVDGTAVTAVTAINKEFLAKFSLKAGEAVTFEGAGGAKVQAWIVKPNTFKEGQKYPLLYLVHGGPQSAWNDGWTYRWNAQVFASAGYVVFMPNPRGSTGFGQKFTDEISNDWGGKPFDDLMKGVDAAEKLPYVDATRKVAAGASYGGYMMNWFLGHTDRFKAIVSHAGVFNLTSMYGVTEELWFPEWDLGGMPWTNPESYAKWSPHTYAKNFKTPTLVSHGELDFRVPIGEGLQLFTTLQRQGVPSRLLYFPDEGHWINKPQNSALWYHTFLDWMGRWTK
ncbi:MAG: S9 family peptidase [Acidobacteria bacterium]|nr:S9 family peptidase [Acidobacteriota bacterium]